MNQKAESKDETVHKEMIERINRDWDIFCKEAQKEIDRFYKEIVTLAKEPLGDAESFIEGRVSNIQTIKRSVEEARRTKRIRLDDLEKIEFLTSAKEAESK